MVKRKNIIKGKKANAFADSFTVLAIVIVLLMTSVIGYMVYKELGSSFTLDGNINAEVAQETNTQATRYGSIMDNMVVLVFVMSWMGVLIFSFLVDSHPVFLIIAIIFLVVILIVTASVANMYADFADSDGIAEYAQDFPKSRFIADNLVLFILAVGASIIVVLYGKTQ